MDICPREPTQEMLVAGRKQIFADMVGEHMGPNCERAWKAMFDARPTADLGELVEKLRNLRVVLKSGDYDGADLMSAWCAMSDAADRLILYREVLAFYADPENYHAIGFLADPPCGGFADDFSYDHGHEDYDRAMPGKRARDVLSRSVGK